MHRIKQMETPKETTFPLKRIMILADGSQIPREKGKRDEECASFYAADVTGLALTSFPGKKTGV